MSAHKTERLLNLVICLLSTRQFLAKEQIRAAVPQYAECPSDEAFDRMFERDKEELRDMGIPLETGGNDAWFDDEVGYRVDRAAYALPEVAFTPDELAVLGLASRVWQQASLAAPASRAVLKLKAAGVEPDLGSLVGIEPRVRTSEPAFEPVYAAVRDRRPIRFPYRTPGQPATSPSGTSSRGASCPGTAAGTSSATTATAAPPGCSGSPGSPGRCAAAGRDGEVAGPGGHRPAGPGRHPGADPRPRARPGCASARAPASGCGGGPPPVRDGRRTAWTSSPCPTATSTCWPRRSPATAPTSRCMDPPELQGRRRTPAARRARRRRRHRRRGMTGAGR